MVYVPPDFIPEYRPARKFSILSPNGWWLNRWPLLGWLETFVKIAAWCFVPYVPTEPTSLSSFGTIQFNTLSKPFALESVIMLLASCLIAAAIIDRLVYREIISMIFVFPNNWAHWTITSSMLRNGQGRDGINVRYFRIFCWLMLVGDIVKLIFFAVHDFSRLNVARYVLYMLVAIFALMYALVLAIEYGCFPHTVARVYHALPLAAIFSYFEN